MVIVKFLGGLGNQIFQYALGKKLSQLYKTPLVSDIHAFKNYPDRSFVLGKFDIKIIHLPWKLLKFLNSNYARNIDDVFRSKLYHELIIEDDLGDSEIPKKGNLYLNGTWGLRKYHEEIVSEIVEDIKLKDKFKTKEFNEVLNLISKSNAVGIHIRRGDYAEVEKYRNYYGLLPVSYYESSYQYFKDKIADPNFFIFSDDPEWVRANMPFFHDAFFVTEMVGGIDYLEFELLKSCKHQVTANSTFSWWAARLNDHDKKIVIQPKTWCVDPRPQAVYEREEVFYIKESIKL